MLTTSVDFGVASHGVNWAASKLPADFEACLAKYPKAAGQDDYVVRFAGKGKATVLANSAVGAIAGLLDLAKMIASGQRRSVTRKLKFRTRNYKHEMRIADHGARHVTNWTDEMFESLVQQIVSRQFNGLTLYPDDCHPFPHLLDFTEFRYAVAPSDEDRAATRAAVNRFLAIAHQYGLKTFMQHYIGHFTKELVDHLGISQRTSDLLSGIETPEITGYVRYCYREVFAQCPDLDGLYFNFESMPNSYRHLMETAVPVCNAMAIKPIFVFRLWNAVDVPAFKALWRAYKGRKLTFHKVADTSDTYHYPSADSRVYDWHKIIPGMEFGYCIGPCHNCGTNLTHEIWADYEYVQQLVGDAHRKGAEAISFHSWWELLAAEVPGGEKVFPDRELHLSRYNILHLDAIVDFVNSRSMPAVERAARMATRLGVGAKAGKAVLELLEATSKIVITVYEQFYHSLAWEGFLNPGRNSHIRDPFYFYPSNGINNTKKLNIWTAELGPWAWIHKSVPVKVAPDDLYQPILDYVDPAKPKARCHPKHMADLIRKSVERSEAAIKKLRAAGAGKIADELVADVKANAMLGWYTYHEILAAIDLYSLYFAKTKPAMLKALGKGLAQLLHLPAVIKDPEGLKIMSRSLYWDEVNPDVDIAPVRGLLATMQKADFPMDAFGHYVESHRQYNEIRRYVRAYHKQNDITLGYARKQIAKAQAEGRKAKDLLGDASGSYAANVQAWLDYLDAELAHMAPPATTCGDQPLFHSLFHDDCFRMGEHFIEDFASFFKPVDYQRPKDLSAGFWRTDDALVISYRERGCDLPARLARWKEYQNSGSDGFVMQARIMPPGGEMRSLTLWPNGLAVSMGTQFVDVATKFQTTADGWEATMYVPFALLGATPKKGQSWRINVTTNPFIRRNMCYTWSPQYDCINPGLFGKVKF